LSDMTEGFFILDKPGDMTSFSASRKAGRLFGVKESGHCGTLDPMATGVLPVALGRATAFIDYLPDAGKAYRAVMRLGLKTDTDDITGSVTAESGFIPDADSVTAACSEFVGRIEQVPPVYSAVKRDGVRMYELARRGETPDIPPRVVEVRSIVCTPTERPDEFVLECSCSKGTYLRALIRDIGEKLGSFATMTALRRTRSNGFGLDMAVSFDALEASGNRSEFLVPLDSALSAYPAARLSQAQSVRFSNGGSIDTGRLPTPVVPGLVRMLSPDGVFLGLGELKPGESEILARRVLGHG
nr:tRNA pseudouridine(55) synthase TruB [Clostridia bacterium]